MKNVKHLLVFANGGSEATDELGSNFPSELHTDNHLITFRDALSRLVYRRLVFEQLQNLLDKN